MPKYDVKVLLSVEVEASDMYDAIDKVYFEVKDDLDRMNRAFVIDDWSVERAERVEDEEIE